MMLLTAVLVALLCLESCASGGMSCIGIRNKEQGDCAAKHEHLCNMQSGLWTKNYILSPHNGSYKEILDSCACCFLPDVYRTKVTQRGHFDTVIALESEAQSFVNRIKPCSPISKACSKTSDCCTGYCSVSDQHSGFCNDPLVLKDSQDVLKSLSADSNFMVKKRGHPLYSDLSSSSTTGAKVVSLDTTTKRTNATITTADNGKT